MSLAAACWWTLARTALICLFAFPIMTLIERWFRNLSDQRRPWALAVLIAPFLFPELLVGYTYRETALRSPAIAEWLCLILLFVRTVPVGVVALLTSKPSSIDAEALHCRWILLRANPGSTTEWLRLFGCLWHGPVRRALPALGLIGLVGFQEFELAALLQATSWTDWFIAAKRTGMTHVEMMERSAWPMIMQLPLLAGIVCWFTTTRSERTEAIPRPMNHWQQRIVLFYLASALTFGCLIPCAVVGWKLPSGLKLLASHPMQWMGLGKEILVASCVSTLTGLTAWFVAKYWTDANPSERRWSAMRNVLLLPGLIGSLLLSLFLVNLFQQPWLRGTYDSPIPWPLALLIWLMPRAVLLRLWLDKLTQTEGVHLAEILQAPQTTQSKLLFRLRDQPRLLGMGLLCYWAYLDLSTAVMLAPSGIPSGLVRLYNFMHYNRTEALSAESFVFFGTPLLGILVGTRLFRPRR